ncbi:MAG TPA: cysteine synthase A [Kofleriaceae bacterium]|nr:cysteine synthase A [Kofleriaceae bacterium]
MPIYDCVADTVGRTPLIRLTRLSQDTGATILGKMESRNPCASVKDRIGVAMIRDAEARGTLKPGAIIVEATSGNTGIALAFAAASIGYKLIITMPENMSRERVALLRTFGAEVVLTRGGLMASAVEKAEEIARNTPGAVMLRQFDNPANPAAHRSGTAVEILEDTGGKVDAFVAGVGTGGTITGVGQVLKKELPEVKIVAVEPAESAVLSGKPAGPHYIQGIGAGFVPEILDREVIDEIITVTERASLDHARRLAREEGIFAGISSGAAVAAAIQYARTPAMQGKQIIVILPDTGERYMSTALVEDLVR